MAKRLSTKTKLRKLGAYLSRNHHKLRGVHISNISGIGIGKKEKNGQRQRQYSVIFHVIQKTGEGELEKRNIIPKYIRVKLDKGHTIRIKTDVIETGEFHLHYGIGASVSLINSGQGGSVGLFLTDQNQNIYGLTNYHVLGENLMGRGIFQFLTDDLRAQNTRIGGVTANFFCGMLSPSIDAALVLLGPAALQTLNNPANAVNGQEISNQEATSFSVGDSVMVFGFVDKNRGSHINQVACSKFDNDTNLNMNGLISLNRVTNPGDSGCILLLTGAAIMPVGLIIGADTLFSYAIPLTTILPALEQQFHLSLNII